MAILYVAQSHAHVRTFYGYLYLGETLVLCPYFNMCPYIGAIMNANIIIIILKVAILINYKTSLIVTSGSISKIETSKLPLEVTSKLQKH